MKCSVRIFSMACLVVVSMASPVALASGGGAGSGAGSGSGSGSAGAGGSLGKQSGGPLAKVRDLQAAGQWQAAIDELRRINATGDPMWNNLMGYSLRRNDPPDFAAAEKYYSAALAIDPKHRPTLEYLGELRLQQGDLSGAERELEALKHATLFRSEEFKDLREAIASYKAAGNKYLPKND
jgi:tetratricopeptide (TPR) repeat protein